MDIPLPCQTRRTGTVASVLLQLETVLEDRARATQCHLAFLGQERDLIQVKCD